MDNAIKPILVFTSVVSKASKTCYWCHQNITPCDTCNGTGYSSNSTCKLCNGSGRLCPTHNADWPGN